MNDNVWHRVGLLGCIVGAFVFAILLANASLIDMFVEPPPVEDHHLKGTAEEQLRPWRKTRLKAQVFLVMFSGGGIACLSGALVLLRSSRKNRTDTQGG